MGHSGDFSRVRELFGATFKHGSPTSNGSTQQAPVVLRRCRCEGQVGKQALSLGWWTRAETRPATGWAPNGVANLLEMAWHANLAQEASKKKMGLPQDGRVDIHHARQRIQQQQRENTWIHVAARRWQS